MACQPILTLLLTVGIRHSSSFSLDSGLQFSASWRYSNKPVITSWGHHALLVLQSLSPAAPACSLSPLSVMECTPLCFSVAGSVLLPWAVNVLTSKLLLTSSVHCVLFSALSITLGQDAFLQQDKEEPLKMISQSLSVFGVAMI